LTEEENNCGGHVKVILPHKAAHKEVRKFASFPDHCITKNNVTKQPGTPKRLVANLVRKRKEKY
jgi:hypothetical protein